MQGSSHAALSTEATIMAKNGGGVSRIFGGATGNAVDSRGNRAAGAGNSTKRGVSSAQPHTTTEGVARAPGSVGQRPSTSHSGTPGGGSHHKQSGNSKVVRPKGASGK